jgi:hypothetical protein
MSTSPTVNPLGYQGVHSPNPPAIWFRPRDPDLVTFKDFRNYQIGDEWQNTATRQFFKMVAQPTGQGVWFPITYYINGVMMTLTSDAGIATPAGGTITVAGGNNINTSAAGAILTINLTAPVTVPNGGTGAITLTGIVTGNGIAAFTASPVAQFNVLVGAAANAVASVAPTAAAGIPLISQGVAANPLFGTAVVAGGGTGIVTTTAYAPICGGTTATGAFQAATTGFATVGSVLTSNGNAALPEWKSPAIVKIRAFTIADTGTNYAPTAGTLYCIVEVIGGGGGGGGTPNSTGTQACAAGGGGGGGYARKVFAVATVTGQLLTIGAGGAGGAAGANIGVAGGTTSVGALISATGGSGGAAGFDATYYSEGGGVGGAGATGDFNTHGHAGGAAIVVANGGGYATSSGFGGSTFFGGGAIAVNGGSGAGIAATSYGGGGSGGNIQGAANGVAGGNGFAGLIVVTEFIS